MTLEQQEIKKQGQWKKLLLSTVAGGIAMWLLAGLWHLILALHFYRNETGAEHEGLGVIVLAYLILGFLMAYLYQRGFKKKCSVIEGFIFGGIIGVLWVFPHELVMAGAHGGSVAYVIKNAIWHIIEQGLGGIVISLIYKYPVKKVVADISEK